ncbi:hypothetical protein Y032_0024g1007 [Ancylostoma ceylanicum]|uniref:Uncharacterized protein n=1 Tax=Ancylostoma ceylanicum TaxID=53326 RepID=A0A016UWZ8_9BILA|nr:hypothetical protein Y032_0024g1007 [Ancylostoma ceylanicum]
MPANPEAVEQWPIRGNGCSPGAAEQQQPRGACASIDRACAWPSLLHPAHPVCSRQPARTRAYSSRALISGS